MNVEAMAAVAESQVREPKSGQSSIDAGEAYDFVAVSNPHAWLLSASSLHEQAKVLRRHHGASTLTQLDKDEQVVGSWDASNKAVFLLCGFAVENVLKGYLVFENPAWISNGRISRCLRSHDLLELKRLSKTVPSKRKYDAVLSRLGEGTESWARYPCGLSIEETTAENVFTPELWSLYVELIGAYATKLMSLLSNRLWKGPHGFEGSWIFSGDFFGLHED